MTEAIAAFRFNEAAAAVYRFVWNVYCDWYVELAKPTLLGEDGPAKDETRAMTAWARDQVLRLLHPFMPFITEELWGVTAGAGAPRETMLVLAAWPQSDFVDADAETEIGWVIELIAAIRSARSEMNVPPATLVPLALVNASAQTRQRADRWSEVIRRMGRIAGLDFVEAPPPNAVQIVVRGELATLPLDGVIDLSAERARLQKELARVEADIARADAKLNNADFINRAREEVVEGEREKREAAEARRVAVLAALARLQAD